LTDVIKEKMIADMMAGSQSSDITHKDPRAQREGHVKRTKKEAQHARITQQTQHQHEIRAMEAGTYHSSRKRLLYIEQRDHERAYTESSSNTASTTRIEPSTRIIITCPNTDSTALTCSVAFE